MTELRDKIAIAAMNGLISSSGGISELKKATNILIAEGYPAEGVEVVAMVSYELADAMMRVRAQRREDGRTKPAKKSNSLYLTE